MGGTCHCIKHPHMIGLFLGLPWFATCMCLFVVKILVLTCFFLKFLVLTCFSQTCAQVKKRGTLTSFGVDMFFLKLLVLTCVSQTRANQKIGKLD